MFDDDDGGGGSGINPEEMDDLVRMFMAQAMGGKWQRAWPILIYLYLFFKYLFFKYYIYYFGWVNSRTLTAGVPHPVPSLLRSRRLLRNVC